MQPSHICYKLFIAILGFFIVYLGVPGIINWDLMNLLSVDILNNDILRNLAIKKTESLGAFFLLFVNLLTAVYQ